MNKPFLSERECLARFGYPGNARHDNFSSKWLAENIEYVKCPWQLHYGAANVTRIGINKVFAPSLALILNEIWEACGKSQLKINAAHYDRYSGAANFRLKRTASELSMHAFAAAIDFDAANNGLGNKNPFFKPSDILVSAFERHGWTWGGRWKTVDAMHFQAPRVNSTTLKKG